MDWIWGGKYLYLSLLLQNDNDITTMMVLELRINKELGSEYSVDISFQLPVPIMEVIHDLI